MSHKNMPRHSANRLLCAAPVLADYGENFDNSIDLLVTGRTCGDVEDHDGWGDWWVRRVELKDQEGEGECLKGWVEKRKLDSIHLRMS